MEQSDQQGAVVSSEGRVVADSHGAHDRPEGDTEFAMDRVGIGITWADPETGRLLYANDYHAKTLGYSRDEMLGFSVVDIDPNFLKGSFTLDRLHPVDDRQEFLRRITGQIQGGFECDCQDG